MLIIKAEVPAGPTIEEAMLDAVIFAARNNCMVSMDVNDVPMLISNGSVFGKDENERAKYFANEFRRRYNEKNCLD